IGENISLGLGNFELPDLQTFSNSYPCSFTVNKIKYKSIEHYYQSEKFCNEDYCFEIRSAKSSKIARELGHATSIEILPNWKDIREGIMKTGLLAKFTQNENLKNILLLTGVAKLFHLNENDPYWSYKRVSLYQYIGSNRLGVLLMEVRSQIRDSCKPDSSNIKFEMEFKLSASNTAATMNPNKILFFRESNCETESKTLTKQLTMKSVNANHKQLMGDSSKNQKNLNDQSKSITSGYEDKIFESAKLILKELSLDPSQFVRLTENFLNLEINSEPILNKLVGFIFDEVFEQPASVVIYANFCYDLHLKINTRNNLKKDLFRLTLVNKCHDLFKKKFNDELTVCVQFIGELFKKSILTEKIIRSFIICLLKNIDNERLEISINKLCELISIIGPMIDPRAKSNLESYFQQIIQQQIIQLSETSLSDSSDMSENIDSGLIELDNQFIKKKSTNYPVDATEKFELELSEIGISNMSNDNIKEIEKQSSLIIKILEKWSSNFSDRFQEGEFDPWLSFFLLLPNLSSHLNAKLKDNGDMILLNGKI
ncbi:hypothetical protein HK096_010121, partial [Nowakowskiella sp. JEL0078]